jgi:hypothetical protein
VKGRVLVLVFFCYVTLDLSLAAMPGAFVFESEETVESTLGARGRLKAEVASVPARTRSSIPRWQPRLDPGPRRPMPHGIARLENPGVTYLPRASCAPPPPSEDPH